MIAPIAVAFLAGALVVYIHYQLKPVGFAEPAEVLVDGVTLQRVAGADGTRPRVLLAAGALVACLIFLARSISTLL